MKNILIVDDEKKMREFMSFFLSREGYQVYEAEDGEMAVKIMKELNINLLIIDLMMPKMDGFQACEAIRKFSSAPIIMLTAVEGEHEHIRGYQVGVDDYITKPIKVNILLAKINRILGKYDDGFTQYNELRINMDSREIYVENQMIDLTPKLYDLLVYMLDNKNIVLSREQILDIVWGIDFEGGTRVVDNHIKKLRNKLKPFSESIKTVIGFGYKLEV